MNTMPVIPRIINTYVRKPGFSLSIKVARIAIIIGLEANMNAT